MRLLILFWLVSRLCVAADPIELKCKLARKDPSQTVGYLFSAENFCSGVLLSPHVVLTAAHCVKDRFPKDLKFTVKGHLAQEAPTADAAVASEILIHPSYWKAPDKTTGGADIALVKLANKNYGGEPLHYPEVTGVAPRAGETFISWGYGIDDDGKARTKRKKEIRYQRMESLLGKNGEKLLNVRMAFIRGDAGEIPCSGDSGGPVVKQESGVWKVVAVNSRLGFLVRFQTQAGLRAKLRNPDYVCKNVDVFHSISTKPFLSWIRENHQRLETEGFQSVCK